MTKISKFLSITLLLSALLFVCSSSLAAVYDSSQGYNNRLDVKEVQDILKDVKAVNYEDNRRERNFSSRGTGGCDADHDTCDTESFLVALLITFVNYATGDAALGICSGFVIKTNPLAVLTAGHCLADEGGYSVFDVEIAFGYVDLTGFNTAGTTQFPADTKTITVSDISSFHYELSTTKDIGLIVDQRAETIQFATANKIRAVSLQSKCEEFEEFRACGFGVSKQRKNYVLNEGAICGFETACFGDVQCEFLLGQSEYSFCANGISLENCGFFYSSCSGDSGGIAYIRSDDGKIQAVGIITAGLALKLGNKVIQCVQGSTNVFTLICQQYSWIKARVSTLDDPLESYAICDEDLVDKTGCQK